MTRDDARRLAGRLVMAAPAGRALTERERSILREGRVGHLILFRRNLRDREEAAQLVAEAREAAPGKILVAADQEGGVVAVARDILGAAPSAMHLGARGDNGVVRRWARAQSAGLRGLGVDVVLAPVLDVQSRGGSEVIGTRSFGGRPRDVARFGAAAVRGAREAGAIAVAKHFPGHGGVRADSHVGLPVDRRPRRAILADALVPYRAAIDEGLEAVMIAHVAYPALGAGRRPASLAPEIIGDLLRGTLGFKGVVMSDALEMEGFPGEEAMPAAFAAGIDLFCAARSLAQGARVAERLARAIRSGEIARESAEEAARRIETLADTIGGPPRAAAAPPEEAWRGIARLGAGSWRPPGRGAWKALVPARLGGRLSLPVDLVGLAGRWGDSFVRERVVRYLFDPSADECRRVLGRAGAGETLVLMLLSRGALPEGQRRLLGTVAGRRGRTILVALLDPEPIRDRPEERIFTFDFRPPTLEGLFRVLLGEKAPEGRMPDSSR